MPSLGHRPIGWKFYSHHRRSSYGNARTETTRVEKAKGINATELFIVLSGAKQNNNYSSAHHKMVQFYPLGAELGEGYFHEQVILTGGGFENNHRSWAYTQVLLPTTILEGYQRCYLGRGGGSSFICSSQNVTIQNNQSQLKGGGGGYMVAYCDWQTGIFPPPDIPVNSSVYLLMPRTLF